MVTGLLRFVDYTTRRVLSSLFYIKNKKFLENLNICFYTSIKNLTFG